jgi:hypothetical protein
MSCAFVCVWHAVQMRLLMREHYATPWVDMQRTMGVRSRSRGEQSSIRTTNGWPARDGGVMVRRACSAGHTAVSKVESVVQQAHVRMECDT